MAILKPNAFEFFSHSAEQTRRLGVRLGAMLPVGTVICLEGGDLGSGKTTLVQGIAQGWGGSTDRVTSPTFVILNQYRRPNGMQLFTPTLIAWLRTTRLIWPFSTLNRPLKMGGVDCGMGGPTQELSAQRAHLD